MATNGITNPAFDKTEDDNVQPLEDKDENNGADEKGDFEGKATPSKVKGQSAALKRYPAELNMGTNLSDDTDTKSTRDHEEQVSMWKDHSQTACTTSLSIVQVALLKTVLDLGPDESEHYYVTLTFIIINIILSVMSGVLVLVLYVIRYNLSKMIRCLDVQNQDQVMLIEAMNVYPETEADVEGTDVQETQETQDIRSQSQTASGKKSLAGLYSEFYSNLCIQELALQMVLSDLLEDDDESEEYQKKLTGVLRRLRAIKRQRSLVRSKAVKQKQESHRTYTALIQTAITLMMFLSTITNMFVVIFGFTADQGVPRNPFSSFNSSIV